ncbi:MAG: MBL fold metallo-hydrolase [Candidatus Hodarchaeales archaeon]|jgi:ribonuclease BN (tRNA processing enzyme)
MTTKVILLGTGTPIPDPERFGPSVVVMYDTSVYIVDFGPGVVRRAIAAGIRPSQLFRAFLSHMHSDHTAGFPDLLLTPAVEGRTEPLTVYGPKGLKSMTDYTLKAYEMDIKERIHGLEPANEEGYVVKVHEIEEGLVYQDPDVNVEAFLVDHGSWQAYGYKFTTPDKIIVISGDTAPSSNLIKHAKNCDILIHEVYSNIGLNRRNQAWKNYHSSVHTSSFELAEIASLVNPGLLILYHQLFMNRTEDELLAEVKKHYNGMIVSGNDLDVFQ